MKKVIIGILIVAAATAGYLYYDWYTKTNAATEGKITLYSWTDANGRSHFSDQAPPHGARNVRKTTGYKTMELPLVLSCKHSAQNIYYRAKYWLTSFFKSKPKKMDPL